MKIRYACVALLLLSAWSSPAEDGARDIATASADAGPSAPSCPKGFQSGEDFKGHCPSTFGECIGYEGSDVVCCRCTAASAPIYATEPDAGADGG